MNVAFFPLLKYLNRSEKVLGGSDPACAIFYLMQLLNWQSSKVHCCHPVVHFCKVQQTYRYIQYINIYIYIYIFGDGKSKINACFIFKLLILIPYCMLLDEETAVPGT